MAAAFPESTVPGPQDSRNCEFFAATLAMESHNMPEHFSRKPVIHKTVTWILTYNELFVFRDFYDNTLAYGLKPFTATWMTDLHPSATLLYFVGDKPYTATNDEQLWYIEAIVEVFRE